MPLHTGAASGEAFTVTADEAARFWSRVDMTGEGCWEWPSPKGVRDYAQVHVASLGRQTGAHRVAFCTVVGAIPAGMVVLHMCDNPRCVRPEHLQLGTQGDNMRDKVAKGRHVGFRSGSALGSPRPVTADAAA